MKSIFLGFETDPVILPEMKNDCISYKLTNKGVHKNIKAEFQKVCNACKFDLPPVIDDLLLIATFCLEADKKLQRGSAIDTWLEKWNRNIYITAKVTNEGYSIFNQPEINQKLCKYLDSLTGDNWHFSFISGRLPSSPDDLFPGSWELNSPTLDSVLMFSGGLDSLGCLLLELDKNHKPMLASHISNGILNKAQKDIIKELEKLSIGKHLPHVAYYSSSCNSSNNDHNFNKKTESTQRTRGFLYATIGLSLAVGNGLNRVVFSDNGITSLNLPIKEQNILARSSRATHPYSLLLFQELANSLIKQPISIDNPLKFFTKADVFSLIEKKGNPKLVSFTNSCSRQRITSTSKPYCGSCSQCIDRRINGLIANSTGDYTYLYDKDILKDSLDNWIDRMQVLGYIQSSQKIIKIEGDLLPYEFPELSDLMAILTDFREREAYISLIKNNAKAVVDLLNDLISKANLASSDLPDKSMLRLVARVKDVDSRAELIDELRQLFRKRIHQCSNWGKWNIETDAQKDVDLILNTWSDSQFNPETPLLPFFGIKVKPDFNKTYESNYLYIEVKHIKDKKELGNITSSIKSRLDIYPEFNAYTLFLVLDPFNSIKDRDKLSMLVEGKPGCWIEII